jgi:hypothetical protein
MLFQVHLLFLLTLAIVVEGSGSFGLLSALTGILNLSLTTADDFLGCGQNNGRGYLPPAVPREVVVRIYLVGWTGRKVGFWSRPRGHLLGKPEWIHSIPANQDLSELDKQGRNFSRGRHPEGRRFNPEMKLVTRLY